MAEVEFLFGDQLIARLESLIRNAKRNLFLVSPYIDLDARIETVLRQKMTQHDFELKILFGKREDGIHVSEKEDRFEFLRQFPNVEIRYNANLSGKFYQNDYHYLMTSMSLYDYALADNIEVGIMGQHSKKGLIGKVVDKTDEAINKGMDKVKTDLLGMEGREVDPCDEFRTIFYNSVLLYQTKPKVGDKGGLKGVFGGKQLEGYDVEVDNFSTKDQVGLAATIQTLSINQLAAIHGVSRAKITEALTTSSLLVGDKITEEGAVKGLIKRQFMGSEYIAVPERLPELAVLKKD